MKHELKRKPNTKTKRRKNMLHTNSREKDCRWKVCIKQDFSEKGGRLKVRFQCLPKMKGLPKMKEVADPVPSKLPPLLNPLNLHELQANRFQTTRETLPD
jgi:hypothetical protein